MRALVLAAFALLAASVSGCSKDTVLVRDIGGTVKSPAGVAVDGVEMIDPNSGQSTTASVDSAGNFSVSVYGYGAGVVRVLLKQGEKVVGVVNFDDGHGAKTTLFPITEEPEPTAAPKNGPSGGDSAPDVNYVYAKVNIDLGQIQDKEGKGRFEPSSNPLAHVDTDGDGTPNLADDDDDGDGSSDSVDPDNNGNGIEDLYETDDQNNDGIPDEMQAGPEGP